MDSSSISKHYVQHIDATQPDVAVADAVVRPPLMRLTHLRKTLLLLDFVVMSFVVVVVIISSNALKEFVINFQIYFKTMLVYSECIFRKCILICSKKNF